MIKEKKNAITIKDEIYKYVVSIEQRIKSLEQKIYVSARCLKQIIDLLVKADFINDIEAKNNAIFLLNFIKLKSLINLQERLTKFKQNNELNATKLKNTKRVN